MSKEEPSKERHYKILVYAIEKVGLAAPAQEVMERNYTLYFEKYDTSTQFHDYDGIIVFQGIFEKFKPKEDIFGNEYYECKWNRNLLDRRMKEIENLINNGGFVCSLLVEQITYRLKHQEIYDTDLVKRILPFDDFLVKHFNSRQTFLSAKLNEFHNFIKQYGAAWAYFNTNFGPSIKKIASVSDYVVGFIYHNRLFFVPSLVPENNSSILDNYFNLLADSLTTYLNKRQFEVPEWVDSYQFTEEPKIYSEKSELAQRMAELDGRLDFLKQFKRVLYLGNDPLVEAVASVLENGFCFRVDSQDDFREDLKILDTEGNPSVFIEVKGVNAGVKNPYITQAKTHLYKAGLPDDFPCLLIINTHIKNARTIEEKDKQVGEEQLTVAKRNGVLILRTLDLLNLFKLKLEGTITADDALKHLTENAGWLRVTNDQVEIILPGGA